PRPRATRVGSVKGRAGQQRERQGRSSWQGSLQDSKEMERVFTFLDEFPEARLRDITRATGVSEQTARGWARAWAVGRDTENRFTAELPAVVS
ncbi:MAG TPA: hypothetical protein VF832_10455, partial [Longimicrobiales bacterium]